MALPSSAIPQYRLVKIRTNQQKRRQTAVKISCNQFSLRTGLLAGLYQFAFLQKQIGMAGADAAARKFLQNQASPVFQKNFASGIQTPLNATWYYGGAPSNLCGINAYLFVVAPHAFILDLAVNFGKQGIVTS
jgi:hypothetical protein